MNYTIPNILTLFRIAIIPVLAAVFLLPFHWSGQAAAALFLAATITDFLDGYLARRLGQESPFGAFLDPVADKLMVAVALIMLVQADPTLWMVIPAAIIIGREITISALREWMAFIGERAAVAVSYIGKVKTTAQMVSLVLLLWREPIVGFPTYIVGYVLLYVAAVLTLWSMILYLRAAWPVLMSNGQQEEDPKPVADGE